MKKILAFTSIRSDYDLMKPLYELFHADSSVDFKLIVSGAHLSNSFGASVEKIYTDGFDILLEIETSEEDPLAIFNWVQQHHKELEKEGFNIVIPNIDDKTINLDSHNLTIQNKKKMTGSISKG